MMLHQHKYADGRSGKWTTWSTFLIPKYEPRLRDAKVVAITHRGLPQSLSYRPSIGKYLAKGLFWSFKEVEL